MITVNFTEKEAKELRLVAGNGFGDGDFYNNYSEVQSHDERAYHRAIEKVTKALQQKQ